MNDHSIAKVFIVLTCCLMFVPTNGYEDNTHQKLTNQAIIIAIEQGGLPADFFKETEKTAIVNGAGAPKGAGNNAGEDYTDYEIKNIGKCKEELRVIPDKNWDETFSHFASGKLWGKPAVEMMTKFFYDAIQVWKYGKKEDAAFILGRGLHILQDMVQPQHALDESHCPVWLSGAIGKYNRSYLEYFTEAHIVAYWPELCEYNAQVWDYANYVQLIQQDNSFGCENCTEYLSFFFDARKKGIEEKSPLGNNFTLAQLRQWFPEQEFDIAASSFNLPFQMNHKCDDKTYNHGDDYAWLDFNHASINSIDFNYRLKEAQEEPVPFATWHNDALLSPAVADSAGVIVAFWNEVKDFEECGASEKRRAEDGASYPTCGPPDRPAGEHPDDSVFVKSSVAESSSASRSDEWKAICRVGIGKGLSTMADYGVSSDIMDQLSEMDENSDPATTQILYDRLDYFMARYSGPQNMMGKEVEEAPFVEVAERGFSGLTVSLIESLGEPVKILEEPQERALTGEKSMSIIPPNRGLLDADPDKQRILVLPTGSLYGLGKDSIEHSALQNYVERGGILVCFTQAYGDDFKALPVPEGEELLAAGFKQDVSCFGLSAYPAMDHPILSGIETASVTAGFDGFFRKIPTASAVLLRRTATGEPCVIVYPLGSGYVLASTMYEDWAISNGQSSKDGRYLISNILSWAKDPGRNIATTDLSDGGSPSSIALTLAIKNLSETVADQVEIIVMTPDRKAIALRQTIPVTMPGRSETTLPVVLDMSDYFAEASPQYGIFHCDYRLLSLNSSTGQEEEIQPQGETNAGRFIVQNYDMERKNLSDIIFSVWTDSDVAGNAQGIVHFHIQDLSGSSRTIHLWESYNHENHVLVQTMILPANGNANMDLVRNLTQAGTYRYTIDGENCPARMVMICILGNEDKKNLEISKIMGVDGVYEPADSLSGRVTLTNPRLIDADITVVFTLHAAGIVTDKIQNVHLASGQSLEIPFDFALPGSMAYFNKATIGVGAYKDSAYITGRSKDVCIRPWYPKLTLTPHWPVNSVISSFASMDVDIMNEPGTGISGANCALIATIEDLTSGGSPIPVEVQTTDLPFLNPGDHEKVTINWNQWQPGIEGKYRITFKLIDINFDLNYPQIIKSRTLFFAGPSGRWVGGFAEAGGATLSLKGGISNLGDLTWNGLVAFDCPALGSIAPQSITIAPHGPTSVSLLVPRPESLVPGDYPFTMIFSAEGLQNPVSVQGLLQVASPVVTLLYPTIFPIFRHNEDALLPVTIKTTNAVGPIEATVSAEMNWDGGSAEIASGQSITLDPANPLTVNLTLPIPQINAPGPFSVDIAIVIPQGNITFNFQGEYFLEPARYAASFSDEVLNAGETLQCQIQNNGAFEGNCTVEWLLSDHYGSTVASNIRTATIPVNGYLSFDETTPLVFPGSYKCELSVTDSLTNETTKIYSSIEILGNDPIIAISTDLDLYGTSAPVNLNAHLEDPDHLLDNGELYVAIERYLGRGGVTALSGQPGASWSTPVMEGSGNFTIPSSEWFYDPPAGRGAYVDYPSFEISLSDLSLVASDVNDDGKAELLGIRNGELFITGQDQQTMSKYPIAATWGDGNDVWTSSFMLGVKNDERYGDDLICIGVFDSTINMASILLVRLSGETVWRTDIAGFSMPSIWSTGDACGPVFIDLNEDDERDILFRSRDTIFALDGATGATLWQVSGSGWYVDVLRVGHQGSAPFVWSIISTAQGEKIVLINMSGEVSYQVDTPYNGYNLLTGDVDGDGNDEAVFSDWSGPPQIFSVESEVPVASPIDPIIISAINDLNNDGRMEALFFRWNEEEGSSMLSAADIFSGETLWQADDIEAAYLTIYKSSSEKKILALPFYGECWCADIVLIDADTGSLEQRLGYLDNYGHSQHWFLSGDFDGDGISEFYLQGIMIKSGCLYSDGTAGFCEEWETVWENDEIIVENGNTVVDLNYEPGAMEVPGTYRAISFIYNSLGQVIEVEPDGFAVVSTDIGISTTPFAGKAVRTDGQYAGSIEITNLGTAQESGIVVNLLVDDVIHASWTLDSLAPQAREVFEFTLPSMIEGKHNLRVEAIENGEVAAETRSSFYSLLSKAIVTVAVPEYHLGEPFEVSVEVQNISDVAANLELSLGGEPSDAIFLNLMPYETITRKFSRQAAGPYSSELTVSGDVQRTIPISVPNGYNIAIMIPDIPPQLKGNIRIPLQISQSGPATYSGILTATITPVTGDPETISIPVNVGADETEDVILSFPEGVAGSAHLDVEASLTSSSAGKDLQIFENGIGTVEVVLPSLLGEGVSEIPFVLRNSLPVQGDFDIALVSSSSPAIPVANERITLPPLGSATGILYPAFDPQTTSLTLILNGNAVASEELEVVPNIRADLSVVPEESPDSAPLLKATIENTGYEPLDAELVVYAGAISSFDISLAKGASTIQTIQIIPDNYGGTDAPVQAFLYLPDGTVLSRNISFTLRDAQLTAAIPQAPLMMIPGETNQLSFEIGNSGDLSSQVIVEVDYPDGEMEHFEQAANIPGHGSTSVNIAIDLAPDIPNGLSNAHYRIVSRNDDAVLQEGDIQVTILGPTVEVTASLDDVAYPVGSSAALNITLSLAPPAAEPITVTAAVIEGSFENREVITVAQSETRSYSIPVDSSTDSIAVEVLLPTGRSIYINRFRVYPISEGFSIHPDKTVYNAGENIQVTADLPSQGSLHMSFRDQEATLTGAGVLTHNFSTPLDSKEDSFPLTFEYLPEDASTDSSYGSVPIDVHGVVAASGESKLDKHVYASGEMITGQVVIFANRILSGTLEYFIIDPDGSWIYLGKELVSVSSNIPLRRSFSFPFASVKAGSHSFAFMLVGTSREIYVEGSLPFSSGQGSLLSLSTDRSDYTEGNVPVEAIVTTAGVGSADLSIFLDGSLVNQQQLTLNGTQTASFSLGSISAGTHALKAVLTDSSGQGSSSYCRFVYGSGLPELTGFVSGAGQSENTLKLAVIVQNKGASQTSPFKTTIYDGDPGEGGTPIASLLTPLLAQREAATQTYEWDVSGRSGEVQIFAFIDSDLQIHEWDETNNIISSNLTIAERPAFTIIPEEGYCTQSEITPQVSVDPDNFTISARLNENEYIPGTPVIEDGEYELVVTASDVAGTSFTEVRHFSIDSIPPVVDIDSPAEGACVRPPVTPEISGADPHLLSISSTLNGGQYSIGDPITSEGQFSLVATAADSCGNTSGQVVRNFISDGTPPSVEVMSPLEGESVDPGFVPLVEGNDINGVNFGMTLDGQNYIQGTPVTVDGGHVLIVSATDYCGNTSEPIVRTFLVRGQSAPSLPPSVERFSFFACDPLTVTGNVNLYGVDHAGVSQGFGGHVGSNNDINIAGSNDINGNATPGPGHMVSISGSQNQVKGSTLPAVSGPSCEEEDVGLWASYAQANNNNSAIPAQFLDAQGNFKVNGNKTCTLPLGTYSVTSFTMSGNAKLVAGGAVTIVTNGPISMNGNANANPGGDSQNLLLVCASGGAVVLNGGIKTNLQIYAPLSPITVNGNVTGIGNLWGKTFTANGSVVWSRVVDASAPSLSIVKPEDGTTIEGSMPEIKVIYDDAGTGVDLNSLRVLLDGTDITNYLSVGPSQAAGSSPVPLGSGPHNISVEIKDWDGNSARSSAGFSVW